jgi:hypothetical protein
MQRVEDVAALLGTLAVRASDEYLVSGGTQHVLQSARERRVIGVRDVGDDQRDHVGLLGPQASGERIRPVPELADRSFDALPRRVRHAAIPGQGVGHRGDAHAGVTGDVEDRHVLHPCVPGRLTMENVLH